MFPIVLAAVFLPRLAVVLQGIGCALLSLHFTNLDPAHAYIQFAVEAGMLTNLFLAKALPSSPSSEVQRRMFALVQTGPVAMVTVKERDTIETANSAAVELLAPRVGNLIGQPVPGFLPPLHYALQGAGGPQFRTSMRNRGYRGNGKPFLAPVWFSTLNHGMTPKLGAIITNVKKQQAVSQGGFEGRY